MLISLDEQVQEKKVKKISDMNMDTSKAVANGDVASSSISSSPRPYVANGGYPDNSHNYMSNDFSFSPGVAQSLRLPVVVVLNLSYLFSCSNRYFSNN